MQAKNVKLGAVQKLVKEYPVVPLYGDMPITLVYILHRIPHFIADKATLGPAWGEVPEARVVAHYNLSTHWGAIKDSYNSYTNKFTSALNKATRAPFRKVRCRFAAACCC